MINHLETDVHTRTLPNPYLGHARDNPGRTRLQKADIRAGYILWLRETVNEDDLRLLSEAGLPRAASGHPVVVIDMLEGQPSHLEICTVTSFGGQSIETKIQRRFWSFYPIQPAPGHPLSEVEPLRLENNARMKKNSYVRALESYRISVVLLGKYDNKTAISFRRLVPESLDRVRAACDLPGLRSWSSNQQHSMVGVTPTVIGATSQPWSSQHVHDHPHRMRSWYSDGDTLSPYSIRVPEQLPLLSVPAMGRELSAQVQDPRLSRSNWQQFPPDHVDGGEVDCDETLCISLRTLLRVFGYIFLGVFAFQLGRDLTRHGI